MALSLNGSAAAHCSVLKKHLELAQFPVIAGGRRDREASERPKTPAFIRRAQGVLDAIWLDLEALNQG